MKKILSAFAALVVLTSCNSSEQKAENPEPKDKWLPENVSYNEFGGKGE